MEYTLILDDLLVGKRLRGLYVRKGNHGKTLNTDEIRAILKHANLDFEAIVNKALNEYLPKLFFSCPFTDDLCQQRQCIDCSTAQNHAAAK